MEHFGLKAFFSGTVGSATNAEIYGKQDQGNGAE